MVQYTNLVIASAILASAGPAIAAPFDGRAQEDIEAREPMFNALKNIVTNPASRKVIISDPLKKIGKDGFDSHEAAERNKAHTGPTPAQKAWQNVKANQDKKSRRGLYDFENLEMRDSIDYEDIYAREPMFNALKNIVTNPASRKVIISDPLKKIGKDGYDSHEAAERNKAHTGPTPAQKAWQNVKADQDKKSRRDLYDFEDLEMRDYENVYSREPMFNALKNIVTNPASRKAIITDPLKKIGKDGYDSHEAAERNKAHTGPTPAQKAWQNVKANQDKKSRRDLFDFEYDLD